MQTRKRWLAARIIPVVGLVLSLFAQFTPMGAHAVFTGAFIRLDRMMISTATGGTICAKPATTGTEAKVVITFPDSTTASPFTVVTTASNWTVTTTNMPVIAGTTATAWTGITTATSATSPANVVTFTSGDLTVGTFYCFNFAATNTLTTGSTAAASLAATVETQTSGSATVDKTSVALATIANDQIVVSAVVPPTFVFTLSGNTDAFSTNLDPANVKSTAGRTVTITTNAKGGWITWAKDTRQGLFSASAGYTIPTAGTVNGAPSTLSSASEGYVLGVTGVDALGGCTLAVDPEYVGTLAFTGGTLSGNFQPIGSCTGVSPATANGDTLTLVESASIAGATPAGTDYTDTIMVVGAGNF